MAEIANLQVVFDALKRFGGRPAVIEVRDGNTEVWAYAKIDREARRIAAGLRSRGVAQGEPIGLYAPNSPQWFVARLALIALGAPAVHIDPESDETALAHVLGGSGLKRVFVAAELIQSLDAVSTDGTIQRFVLDGTTESTAAEESVPWGNLRAAPLVSLSPPAPDDVAALFYTSGTTGAPKGVPLTHANIAANLNALLGLKVVGPDDRVLLPLPLHHAYPFIVGMMTSFLSGSAVVLPQAIAGPAIAEACRTSKPTVMVGVPRLYAAVVEGIERRVADGGRFAGLLFRALLTASTVARALGLRFERRLFSRLHDAFGGSLRVLVSGGALLEGPVERTLNALGWQVLNGWGLVETASVATFNPPDRAKPGTVGIPVPGLELRIDGADPTGLGEVVVKGPNVFAGYLNNSLADQAAFTGDGRFRSGDLGRLDASGYLSIVGRIKEIIVLAGGKNIAPEEVEGVYAASPLIREIAVLERAGSLVAVVVPDLEAARSAGAAHLDQRLRISIGEISQSLPTFKRITGYVTAQEPLPRTRLGKYRRHLLPETFEHGLHGRVAPVAPLSSADEALLSRPRARVVWRWLERRFPNRGLSPDTNLQLDLGVDSLAWIELSTEVETVLAIRMPDDALDRVVTIRDLLSVVETAQASEEPVAEVAALSRQRARWLAPTGLALRVLGFAMYAIVWLGCRLYFRLSIEGRKALPKTGPFILAANHCSDIDPLVLTAALPWRYARASYWSGETTRLFRTRLHRGFARAAHIFPVDDRAPAEGLASGVEVLIRGQVLVWFPEAWRSPDGLLQPFLPGIGALVERADASVVPVYIDGTFAAMPRGASWPRPRRVRLRFGSALGAKGLMRSLSSADRPKGIAAKIRESVAKLRDADAPAERGRPA